MEPQTNPLVYLAGPSVFRPDAVDYALGLLSRCKAYGLSGLYPYDVEDIVGHRKPRADSTFRENIWRLEKADVVMADLNPFRGSEPDSGTVFAVGYAYAIGKEVYGHIQDGRSVKDRVGDTDKNGWRVEDFEQPLSLMLSIPLRIVVGTEDDCLRTIADSLRQHNVKSTDKTLTGILSHFPKLKELKVDLWNQDKKRA